MTPVNTGKNHFPDGSGSGSTIVSHLEILALTHQPNSECYSCSTSVTKMPYKSYIVIVQNCLVLSSYTLRSSSSLVMLLLVEKSCMFIHTTLSTNSNVNKYPTNHMNIVCDVTIYHVKSHNIWLIKLTSSKDKLVEKGRSSCVTPSKIYVSSKVKIIKRYCWYMKVDLKITIEN